MAHGYLNFFAGNRFDIYSAGIETHGVHPLAVAVMKEDGVDISMYTSNNIREYDKLSFDFVITVCDKARENCPCFPAKVKIFHHDFPDPAKAKGSDENLMTQFRIVRDEIKKYISALIKNL